MKTEIITLKQAAMLLGGDELAIERVYDAAKSGEILMLSVVYHDVQDSVMLIQNFINGVKSPAQLKREPNYAACTVDKTEFIQWAGLDNAQCRANKQPHGNTQRNEAKRQAIIDAAEKIIAEDRQAFMRGGRLNAEEIWRYMFDHSHIFFGGEPPLRDAAALNALRAWLKTTK